MNATATEPISAYREDFTTLRRAAAPEWLRALREEAFAAFASRGFPGRKEEAWRQIDLRPVRETVFPWAGALSSVEPGAEELRRRALLWPEPHRLVCVDGLPASTLSRTPPAGTGIRVTRIEDHGSERPPVLGTVADLTDPFTAWNTAFLRDALLVQVEAGAAPAEPLHLVQVAAHPGVSHPRVVVVVEPGAELTLIEQYLDRSEDVSFVNAVTEIQVAAGARLRHVRIQREGAEDLHVGSVAVRVGRDGAYESTSVALGGSPGRVNLHVTLEGGGAECRLDGLYLPDGHRVIDHHTVIEHCAPHTTSRQLYKGILTDRARGVFNGMIHIHPGAQQVVAEQNNPNLLLSDHALVHSNPQLRIHADDVQCRHGSTIGRLDEERLFYLRSRGLTPAQARQILVTAFAGEILETIPSDEVRDGLAVAVAERFSPDV